MCVSQYHLPLGVVEASLVETLHHLWGEDCRQFVRHPDWKLRGGEIFSDHIYVFDFLLSADLCKTAFKDISGWRGSP